jgi:hypothetical protein
MAIDAEAAPVHDGGRIVVSANAFVARRSMPLPRGGALGCAPKQTS